jgi:predicted phosphodiesterase
MRVFALSDIHADYHENMAWLQAVPAHGAEDVLILAGDVSDNLDTLGTALSILHSKFARIFFVPGNHELWVRRGECADSMTKFSRVLELCSSLSVETSPAKVCGARSNQGAWLVPLFAWYEKPDDGPGSLFVQKEAEDSTVAMWADDYFTKWPAFEQGLTVAEAFLRMNRRHLDRVYDAPLISFSHFVPRTELIRPAEDARAAARTAVRDANPCFNFSRVAGCAGLEAQIRRLGAHIHVYGHQHRNRRRVIDGVLYLSHCLGYPEERTCGYISDVANGPLLIWDTGIRNPSDDAIYFRRFSSERGRG